MTNVYLYGELKNKFGEEFNLKINSPKEAFIAINANRRGFLDEIKKQASKGILYRIVIDDQVINDKSDLIVTKIPKEIHIVPIVWGAGGNSGNAFKMIGAAILIAVAAYFGGPAGAAYISAEVQTGMYMIAAAVAVQGVMMLLYPQAKPDFNQEVNAGGKSYLFGNKTNNQAQGQAVPVGYGRLLVGSSQVSASTNHYSLKQDMRALMTPTDMPIDDYMELDFVDEAVSFKYDSFYTNQSSSFDDTPSFSSINILNSYINILTKNAETVTSSIVEAVVKTDGLVVSNPDLTSYNEDVSFTWTDLTAEKNKANIKIENPYSFDDGLVYRVYRASDFELYSRYSVTNDTKGYFSNYDANQIVSYGPSQFEKLNFQKWDENIPYISGELIWHDTGDGNQTRYRSKILASGHSPTGAGYGTYWEQLSAPANEEIYKCLANGTSGYLPTDIGQWSKMTAPSSSGTMNDLTNLFGTPSKEDVYADKMDTVSPYTIDGSESLVANSMMEFLGYFHVPKVADREIDVVDAVSGVMYEITKVGTTNWTSIGVSASASPTLGTTFTKNTTTATGNGKIYPVVKYKFTLDCDDGADLYIDGERAVYKYGEGGMSFPKTNAEISSLSATLNSSPLKLTTGYHKLYARLYNHLGASGLSLYYQYDSNWDGTYSDWKLIPADLIKHQKLNDLGIGKNIKFLSKMTGSMANSNFVTGNKYKIIDLGSISNWNLIGASSAAVGSIFVKNSTAVSGSGGVVFSDTYSDAEAKSAESNRLVRFVAQRPKDIDNTSNQGAIYRADYQCTAKIGRITLYSSPVKIYIKFLPVTTNFKNIEARTILPIETQQTA